jgi:hypothetical protein
LEEQWTDVLAEQLMLMSGFHRDQKTLQMSSRAAPIDGIAESKGGGLLSILDKLSIFDFHVEGQQQFHENVTAKDIFNRMEKVY